MDIILHLTFFEKCIVNAPHSGMGVNSSLNVKLVKLLLSLMNNNIIFENKNSKSNLPKKNSTYDKKNLFLNVQQ